ncbi:MAG TPA: hypothetical protein VHB77_16740 [Planctomycetaceae bacterium]|nr:hypothetical protein [Planctomycetaceae bacterium]
MNKNTKKRGTLIYANLHRVDARSMSNDSVTARVIDGHALAETMRDEIAIVVIETGPHESVGVTIHRTSSAFLTIDHRFSADVNDPVRMSVDQCSSSFVFFRNSFPVENAVTA